jgi:hypothetical protein
MSKTPPRPNHIGVRGVHTTIDGRKEHRTIEDEIVRRQSGSYEKLIYFQRLLFEEDCRTEYRLTYYMLSVKPGQRQGRWVFGQFSLMVPPKDLAWLLSEARKRGWPEI